VAVPDKLALQFNKLEMIIVQLSDDLGRLLFSDHAQFLIEINYFGLHDDPPYELPGTLRESSFGKSWRCFRRCWAMGGNEDLPIMVNLFLDSQVVDLLDGLHS
jgi:hypothetical protein